MKKDTIAAISTGMTNSGIGIVRLSGNEALEIADKVYRGKEKITEVPSHTIHYGHIADGEETVDEVLMMVMHGPRTFTGEDTVEINCHGGTYVVSRVLETVLKYGARAAEPGEFTKRAFLNGKMDLSQAEAVIDLINSENEYALQSSVSQLKGSVKSAINELRSKILYHTAFIETALDDPEHISVDGYGEILKGVSEEIIEKLQKLIDSADDGRIMKEGIQTVIVGKPNAGKSSLLNLLAGHERAIVTDIAGTTRDVLEEQIRLQGLNLNVIDTAGIRQTEDLVEKMGVDKAKEYAQKAEYEEFQKDFIEDMKECVRLAKEAGIADEKIILDPGVGFGKTYEMNLEIIAHLEILQELGYPVLLGTSRKSVIGLTLDLPVDQREEGTMVTTVYGVQKGSAFVRVHDVEKNLRAIKMTKALMRM